METERITHSARFRSSGAMTLKSVACIFLFIGASSCSLENSCEKIAQPELKFYPLRHCQRSNKTVIAYGNFEAFDNCAEFTRKHRGLAFNFSPKHRFARNLFERSNSSRLPTLHDDNDARYNCQVLECPEHRNFSSTVNDTRFDHFSLYTHPPRKQK